jgi:hypothetical protein
MDGIILRTLEGYGNNGMEFTFPNGTVVSFKYNLEGKPELLVEGVATVTIHREENSPYQVIV